MNILTSVKWYHIVILIYISLMKRGFPGGLEGKASACNAGDPGSIPELGRFPWRRQWHPTPVLLPGKSHGRRSLGGCTVHGIPKSRTWLSDFTFSENDVQYLFRYLLYLLIFFGSKETGELPALGGHLQGQGVHLHCLFITSAHFEIGLFSVFAIELYESSICFEY